MSYSHIITIVLFKKYNIYLMNKNKGFKMNYVNYIIGILLFIISCFYVYEGFLFFGLYILFISLGTLTYSGDKNEKKII